MTTQIKEIIAEMREAISIENHAGCDWPNCYSTFTNGNITAILDYVEELHRVLVPGQVLQLTERGAFDVKKENS